MKHSAVAVVRWVKHVGHSMGSKAEDSILTKYEVEINLHYIVHVIIKPKVSTGKILKRLICQME